MLQAISSTNVLHSDRPLTVGVISEPEHLERFAAAPPELRQSACDLVELRLDLLQLAPERIREQVSGWGVPLLLTARHPSEGGQGSADPAARAQLVEPLLDIASMLDVEIMSAVEMAATVNKARSLGVLLLGSYHDFNATPTEARLQQAADEAEQHGFDILKVAAFLKDGEDFARLVKFTSALGSRPRSIMGMGPMGRVSRLALAKVGSLLNYGFLGSANAPGQWPAPKLKELLAEI